MKTICTGRRWANFSWARGPACSGRRTRACGKRCGRCCGSWRSISSPTAFCCPSIGKPFKTKEYPNYTRAWLTFGLLDAGYAGEQEGFRLARGMGDHFNQSDVLPYVKDMNLGFQGILANTRLYDAPVGKMKDIEVAVRYYQEDWWLEQLIAEDQRAIYDHPGNHPHSTLLTTLEGYCDLYRVTGREQYICRSKARPENV